MALRIVSGHAAGEAVYVAQISVLHMQRLNAGFLPHLGVGMLRRIYMRAAQDADAIFLVALEGDRVRGFIMGAIAPQRFYRRFLMRNAAPLLWNLAKHPGVAWRALSVGRYAATSMGRQRHAELLSVVAAVDGCGVGSQLLAAFGARLAQQGLRSFDVLAADTQEAALRFYRKHGGKVVGETVLGGLLSYRFSMPVTSNIISNSE